MARLLKISLALLLLICSQNQLQGQVNVKKTAQTSMKFLSVPVGARGAALGEAFITVANNAEAMFWNPAGVVNVKTMDFYIGYNKWIADIKHQSAGFVYNANDFGFFGINFSYVDYGTFYGTRRSDVDPQGYIETGEFSPTALLLGLVYSRAVSSKFSFGVNLKYAYQDLSSAYIGTIGAATTEENKEIGSKNDVLALDFGVLYHVGFKDLKFGFVVQNISEEVEYAKSYGQTYSLPYEIKAGMSMNVLSLFMPEKNQHSITVAIDALHPRDYSERVHLGLEYVFNNIFAVRSGYKFNYDEDNFAFGFGVMPTFADKNIRFDYAYNPFGVLDGVHRISFGTSF